MKTLMLAAAMLALSSEAVAQSRSCVTDAEAEVLALATLPVLLEIASDRCRPLLPASAWMSTGAKRLADRYRPEADAAWTGAHAAAGRLLGEELGPFLSKEALQIVVREAAGGLFSDKLDGKGCATMNGILAPLEPLPAPNMARLVIGLVKLGIKDDKELSREIRFCPERAR